VRDTINAQLVVDMTSERKTSLGIPRRRLENITMGFKETGLDCIHEALEKIAWQHTLVYR
jgi:hypothetical protein